MADFQRLYLLVSGSVYIYNHIYYTHTLLSKWVYNITYTIPLQTVCVCLNVLLDIQEFVLSL